MAQHFPVQLQKINEIIVIRDPVQRNLQITQTYCDINQSLTRLFGEVNVSWCAYATWASKTAGKFIRKDNIGHIIEDFVRGSDGIKNIISSVPIILEWLGWGLKFGNSFVVKTLNEIAGEMSRQVAEGNLLVFKELAPLYYQLLNGVPHTDQFQQDVLEQLLAYIDKLETDATEETGKDHLKKAYAAYYQAVFEKDAKAKAELILYANLLVGYHEQMRLDKAINGSMVAPVEKLLQERILGEIAELIEPAVPALLFFIVRYLVFFRARPAIQRTAANWRRLTTEKLMRIEVPDGSLDLSEDLPLVPYLEGGMFPSELQHLAYRPLVELLENLDYTPNTTQGSGARDWGSLADRMNFIADFFRAEQQDPKLFRSPFMPLQTEIIRKGGIPGGRL